MAWAGVALAAFLVAPAAPAPSGCGQDRDLSSPDRVAVARVSVADAALSCEESRVEIRMSGRLAAARSFASSDGQHGYAVRTAAWTSDSRYFVFDLSSSGGHQPLYSPIFVFDARRWRLAPLALPEEVVPSSFRLLPGDRIAVEAWDARRQARTVIRATLGG